MNVKTSRSSLRKLFPGFMPGLTCYMGGVPGKTVKSSNDCFPDYPNKDDGWWRGPLALSFVLKISPCLWEICIYVLKSCFRHISFFYLLLGLGPDLLSPLCLVPFFSKITLWLHCSAETNFSLAQTMTQFSAKKAEVQDLFFFSFAFLSFLSL